MQLIEMTEFVVLCRCGLLIETDGRGFLATFPEVSRIEVLPVDALSPDFYDKVSEFTHVAWYEKHLSSSNVEFRNKE